MRLDWIEDILKVLETGSFNAAAEARFLTPSAFTRRIRSIEEALGCELFDRSKKPVKLLPHAQELEQEMRAAGKQLKRLRTALSDPTGETQNRIVLMCQHALTASVAPGLVSTLSRHTPFNVRVRSGTKSECHLMLLRREVDLALVYETEEGRSQPELLYCDKLFLRHEQFLPVANLAENPNLADQICAKTIPIIVYPSSIYLGELLRFQIFPSIDPGLELQTVVETGLTLAVVEFVRQGLGVGWLPYSVVSRDLENGNLTRLDHLLPSSAMEVNVLRLKESSHKRIDQCWDLIKSGLPMPEHGL